MVKEICQDCGKVFEGGAHAFLCKKCRKKRISNAMKKYHKKKAVEKEKNKNYLEESQQREDEEQEKYLTEWSRRHQKHGRTGKSQ